MEFHMHTHTHTYATHTTCGIHICCKSLAIIQLLCKDEMLDLCMCIHLHFCYKTDSVAAVLLSPDYVVIIKGTDIKVNCLDRLVKIVFCYLHIKSENSEQIRLNWHIKQFDLSAINADQHSRLQVNKALYKYYVGCRANYRQS